MSIPAERPPRPDDVAARCYGLAAVVAACGLCLFLGALGIAVVIGAAGAYCGKW